MVSESHIYLTRCRSCCRRSSLCCAERASRLWVPASQDEGGKQETLRRRRERGRKNCAVTFGWTVVTLVSFRQRKNTAGDWFMLHMFGPANACAFVHRLSARRDVQHLASSPGQFVANITAQRENNTYYSPAVILAKNRPGDEARKHCVYWWQVYYWSRRATPCVVQLLQSTVSLPACSKWESEDHSSKASRHWSGFFLGTQWSFWHFHGVVEEVEYALTTLKPNRSGGPDHLSPEHLKYSGATVFRNWLCHVFNWIIQLEQIPPCFKQVIVIPCFKGKGRDPLLRKNYCGITLTSVISKTLEIIILDWLAPTFENAGFPSLTQTAYRKQVSSLWFCIRWPRIYLQIHLRRRSCVLCFLFHAGVKGKCWRLIKVKCLGIWWTSDSLCRKSIDERMTKANGTFFAHGDLGAFHGLLNARSLVETCVIRHVTRSDLMWPRSDIIRPEVAWKRLGKA